MSSLPKEMRQPRKTRGMRYGNEGWYYINPKSIDIYAKNGATVTAVRLTRQQLQAAIDVMDNAN